MSIQSRRFFAALSITTSLLAGGVASAVVAQQLDLTSRGPRFLAAWAPRETPIDVASTIVLRRRISLDLTDVTVIEALKAITDQGGLQISYSPASLPDDKRVSLHVREITVAAALTEVLFDAGVDVTLSRSGHLALIRRPPAPKARLRDSTDQQVASLTGKVTDQEDGRDLVGARVQVLGSGKYTSTNASGVYTLPGLAAGSHTVRVIMLGYRSSQRVVTLPADQATTLDFSLTAVPFALGEIVTTATGEQLTRELGNEVARIEATKLVEQAPVTNLSEVLNGRIAGVTVISNDGINGSGSRIRIRGISSVSLSNDPLLYVDGVRVSERGPVLSLLNGGNSPSFFNDIKPEEIASIEIVKGPSAATLYGTQAANGVIRITTKRGTAGAPRWTVFSEQGLVHDPNDYPAVYFSRGTTGAGCLPFQQSAGQCQIAALLSRDIIRDPSTTPLQNAYRWQYGGSVSGGTETTQYFASGEIENQNSTIKMPDGEIAFAEQQRGVTSLPDDQLNPNRLRRVSVRANLTSQVTKKLSLAVNSGYINTDNRIPQAGDNGQSIILSSVLGTADPSAPTPYAFTRPAYALANTGIRTSSHFINSANADYRPLGWLTLRGTAGLDFISFKDGELARNGECCPGVAGGLRTLNRFESYKYSVDLGATASFKLTRRLGSKTSIGAQYNKDNVNASLNTGLTLPPGGETFSGAANKSSAESTVEFVTLGEYVDQQFSLDDRLFVSGALRIDRNSAFGADFRSAYYPKIQASYVVRESREKGLLNALRLRSAFGVSGQQPTPLGAITYFTPVPVSVFNTTLPGVTLGGLGNPNLKPERSRELEAGLDATVLSGAVTVGLTYYNKRTTDALVQRPLAVSLGAVSAETENVGTVSNQGIELSLLARPIETRSLTWDAQLEIAFNRNRLVSLAPGVSSPISLGIRQLPGYPLYGEWWPKIKSWSDQNGDGLIAPSEVVATDTAVFIGSSVPTRTVSFNSAVSLFSNRLRIGVQFDYKGGFYALDLNTAFACQFLQNCRAIADPAAPLFDQARAVAAGIWGDYVEDASFVRLREASVSYTLPSRWAKAIRATNATITLTGRNLHLWTKQGLGVWDPEINTAAGLAGDGPNYNFGQPGQPRLFLLRLNLGF